MKKLISHKELVRLLDYNPGTGVFIRKVRQSNHLAGTEAGTVRKDGYVVIRIGGRNYYAHRLAWFYVNGIWPAALVDHRDRNPSNNSIHNLREATPTQNGWNSPVLGCCFDKTHRYWVTSIRLGKKRKWLGAFPTKRQAVSAYKNAVKNLRGEFACAGAVV